MITKYNIIQLGKNKELFVNVKINKIPYTFKLFADGKQITYNSLPDDIILYNNSLYYKSKLLSIDNDLYEDNIVSIIKFNIKRIQLYGINHYQPYNIVERGNLYYICFTNTTYKPYKLSIISNVNNLLSIDSITKYDLPKHISICNHLIYYKNKEIRLTTNNIDDKYTYLFDINLLLSLKENC